MLRCKTDSAKDRARGGPVSSSNDTFARNGSEKAMGATEYGLRPNIDASWPTKLSAIVTKVARSTLQHGSWSSCVGVLVGAGALP